MHVIKIFLIVPRIMYGHNIERLLGALLTMSVRIAINPSWSHV